MLKKKEGFTTIITLILLLITLPLLLFAVVDLPYWMTANRRLQNIVDNIASGASTALVESSLADGIIDFDTSSAEQIILSELAAWFELSPIPALPEGGYTQLLLVQDSESYFQMNPIIMKMIPNNKVDINDVPVGTPIIEYVIYNPKDSRQEQEFILASGNRIKLNKPTVFISVMTKVYAPVMLLPINMHKVSIQEVTIGSQ